MSEEMETPTFGTDQKVYTGRVKWFNNRAGYGFITVSNGVDDAEDLFVHHTAINVGSEQYKYLVEGEYINFKKIASENCDHKFQAGEVRGVEGGQLMCETRNSSRSVRAEKTKEVSTQRPKSGSDMRRAPRTNRVFTGENTDTRVRVRGGGPREEWYLVKRRRGVMDDRGRAPQNKVVTTELVDEEN